MRTDQRLDPETVAWSLDTLLGHLPGATVGAVAADRTFVALPRTVAVAGQAVVDSGPLAALVADDDSTALGRAWEAALATGLGQASVRLADGRRAVLHAFDVRAAHGFVVVVAEALEAEPPGPDGRRPRPAPRPLVCRMRRNPMGAVTDADDAAVAMLGWTREELVGRRPSDLIHPDDFDRTVVAWIRMLQVMGSTERVRARHRRKGDGWVWVEMTHRNHIGDPGLGDVACELVDVSAQVAAEVALGERDDLLRHLTADSSWGIVQLDRAGSVRVASDRALELLAVSPPGDLPALLAHVARPDRSRVGAAVEAALSGGVRTEVEVGVSGGRRGRTSVCRVVARPLHDAAGRTTGAVLSVADLVDDGWGPA